MSAGAEETQAVKVARTTKYIVMQGIDGDGGWKVISETAAPSATVAIRQVVQHIEGTFDVMMVAVPASSFQPKHVRSERAIKLG